MGTKFALRRLFSSRSLRPSSEVSSLTVPSPDGLSQVMRLPVERDSTRRTSLVMWVSILWDWLRRIRKSSWNFTPRSCRMDDSMLGMAGMVAQELVNGKEIFVNLGLAEDTFDPSK